MNPNLEGEVGVHSKDPKHCSFAIAHTNTDSPVTQLTNNPQTQRAFVLAQGSFLEVGVELKGNPTNTAEWPMEEKVRK